MKAAQYLRVAPWDLAAAPSWWMERAEVAQSTEHQAREAKKDKSRTGKKG